MRQTVFSIEEEEPAPEAGYQRAYEETLPPSIGMAADFLECQDRQNAARGQQNGTMNVEAAEALLLVLTNVL
jgi:hypothetical protein